jgi:hypothetical protein
LTILMSIIIVMGARDSTHNSSATIFKMNLILVLQSTIHV